MKNSPMVRLLAAQRVNTSIIVDIVFLVSEASIYSLGIVPVETNVAENRESRAEQQWSPIRMLSDPLAAMCLIRKLLLERDSSWLKVPAENS